MKFVIFYTTFTFFIVENIAQIIKCENKGCYEVIKVFSELLTAKISESDALLAAAEEELNEITNGNNEHFKENIKEVDKKLENLISELTTGLNEEDETLINLINRIFADLANIENLLGGIETENDSSLSNINASDEQSKDVREKVREIQDEINRMLNLTEIEGPQAFQEAKDFTEKSSSDTEELRSIVEEAKTIILDYETNLMNAKSLTKAALERFGEVERKIEETKSKQAEIEDEMRNIFDVKTTENVLESTKKLTRESFDEAVKVLNEAFEMLNKVSRIEFHDKQNEINDNVDRMKSSNIKTMESLDEFQKKNSDLLKEIETTIAKGKELENEALKLQKEVAESFERVKKLREDALDAAGNKDYIIRESSDILSKLTDFEFKVEIERETARRAMEKVERISRKIKDSLKVLGKIEDFLNVKANDAFKKRDENLKVKRLTDELIEISTKIQLEIPAFEDDFEMRKSEVKENDKITTNLGNDLDEMEGREVDDSQTIKLTKENLQRTQQKRKEADILIDNSIEQLERVMNEVKEMRTYDNLNLDEFETKLNEAEKMFYESEIHEKMRELRSTRHQQTIQIENYKLEIAEIEYQISVIKKNAESFESKCFTRLRRLEP